MAKKKNPEQAITLHDELLSRGYNSIPLFKLGTGHIILTARVDKVKGRFILDTGASNSVISFSFAAKTNLEIEFTDEKAVGAGAEQIEMMIVSECIFWISRIKVSLSPVSVMNLDHINSALHTINEKPIDGVIGSDALILRHGIIDYYSMRLYLY